MRTIPQDRLKVDLGGHRDVRDITRRLAEAWAHWQRPKRRPTGLDASPVDTDPRGGGFDFDQSPWWDATASAPTILGFDPTAP